MDRCSHHAFEFFGRELTGLLHVRHSSPRGSIAVESVMNACYASTMASVQIKVGIIPAADALVDLYSSVGWSAYTRHPSRLQEAVRRSLFTATAWEDDRLVGLARVVGDAVSIIYLQDVLVHPSWQRSGIGRSLVMQVFAPFADVRQHVLLTDSETGQTAFYTSLGFSDIRDMRGGLRSFVRIRTQDTD